MLSAGLNISTRDDKLEKIKVEYLYNKIKNPNKDIESLIRQLRVVRQIDSKQYALLKRQLPYFVCGMFNPAVRRTENFAYTEYFLLDIDHIEEHEMSISDLQTRFMADKRIFMCFVSPGQDGLKLMFKLKERCYDAGIYSIFYKLFASGFSTQYALQQVLDVRTSDVTRACFISVDPDAYYNPNAEKVDINQYMDTENVSEMFRIKKELEVQFPLIKASETKEKTEIDDQSLMHIKMLLNSTLKQQTLKQEAYVPMQLNEIIPNLQCYIEQAGVQVKEILNINYGKKIVLQVGLKQAEINLFYGKKGYSVVQSPRRGTNAELNQLMADLILQFILMM